MAFAERLFDAASTLDMLRADTVAPRPVAFPTLYRYATDPAFEPDPALPGTIAADARLATDFAALLRRVALASIPPAAAAATEGEIDGRHAGDWRIRIRRVQANPNQVWVIIDYAGRDVDLPQSLFVDGVRQPLPPARDGRFQFRLDADSNLVRLLRDIDSEVFLV
jgi:hypothetical protein